MLTPEQDVDPLLWASKQQEEEVGTSAGPPDAGPTALCSERQRGKGHCWEVLSQNRRIIQVGKDL